MTVVGRLCEDGTQLFGLRTLGAGSRAGSNEFQALVANARKQQNFRFNRLLGDTSRPLRPSVPKGYYSGHSRLHLQPETDELATDLTLPDLRAGWRSPGIVSL